MDAPRLPVGSKWKLIAGLMFESFAGFRYLNPSQVFVRVKFWDFKSTSRLLEVSVCGLSFGTLSPRVAY